MNFGVIVNDLNSNWAFVVLGLLLPAASVAISLLLFLRVWVSWHDPASFVRRAVAFCGSGPPALPPGSMGPVPGRRWSRQRPLAGSDRRTWVGC